MQANNFFQKLKHSERITNDYFFYTYCLPLPRNFLIYTQTPPTLETYLLSKTVCTKKRLNHKKGYTDIYVIPTLPSYHNAKKARTRRQLPKIFFLQTFSRCCQKQVLTAAVTAVKHLCVSKTSLTVADVVGTEQTDVNFWHF